VAGSGSYAAIYSVFAAMMLFMIWINAGWLVVLIGASLSYYLQNPSVFTEGKPKSGSLNE